MLAKVLDRFRAKPKPPQPTQPSPEAAKAQQKVNHQSRRVDRVLADWDAMQADVAKRSKDSGGERV